MAAASSNNTNPKVDKSYVRRIDSLDEYIQLRQMKPLIECLRTGYLTSEEKDEITWQLVLLNIEEEEEDLFYDTKIETDIDRVLQEYEAKKPHCQTFYHYHVELNLKQYLTQGVLPLQLLIELKYFTNPRTLEDLINCYSYSRYSLRRREEVKFSEFFDDYCETRRHAYELQKLTGKAIGQYLDNLRSNDDATMVIDFVARTKPEFLADNLTHFRMFHIIEILMKILPILPFHYATKFLSSDIGIRSRVMWVAITLGINYYVNYLEIDDYNPSRETTSLKRCAIRGNVSTFNLYLYKYSTYFTLEEVLEIINHPDTKDSIFECVLDFYFASDNETMRALIRHFHEIPQQVVVFISWYRRRARTENVDTLIRYLLSYLELETVRSLVSLTQDGGKQASLDALKLYMDATMSMNNNILACIRRIRELGIVLSHEDLIGMLMNSPFIHLPSFLQLWGDASLTEKALTLFEKMMIR